MRHAARGRRDGAGQGGKGRAAGGAFRGYKTVVFDFPRTEDNHPGYIFETHKNIKSYVNQTENMDTSLQERKLESRSRSSNRPSSWKIGL